jgi:hypothetical protein
MKAAGHFMMKSAKNGNHNVLQKLFNIVTSCFQTFAVALAAFSKIDRISKHFIHGSSFKIIL